MTKIPKGQANKAGKGFRNGIFYETWEDPIYSTKYWIVISEKMASSYKFYADLNKMSSDTPTEGARAMACESMASDVRQHVFILLTDKVTAAQAAHECIHAKNYVFKYHGVKLDLENDEPEAYYIHYLMNKVNDVVCEYNLKIKTKKNGKSRSTKKKVKR